MKRWPLGCYFGPPITYWNYRLLHTVEFDVCPASALSCVTGMNVVHDARPRTLCTTACVHSATNERRTVTRSESSGIPARRGHNDLSEVTTYIDLAAPHARSCTRAGLRRSKESSAIRPKKPPTRSRTMPPSARAASRKALKKTAEFGLIQVPGIDKQTELFS